MHYSADHEKGPDWVAKNASKYPGGVMSSDWLQEFEMDDEAEDGERTYWAFDPERNVIDPFPIPEEWPIYLGIDFGQTAPTAVVAAAQNPKTLQLFFCAAVYRPHGVDDRFRLEVYEMVARIRRVQLADVVTAGLEKYIDLALGDPSGSPYIAVWAQEPFPIYVVGKQAKVGAGLKRIQASEKHVNHGLFPSFRCCNALQYPPYDQPEADQPCALCRKVYTPTPLAYVFDGACQELVDQWQSLVRKEPVNQAALLAAGIEPEAPEVDIHAPNHAADAARYLLRCIVWDQQPESSAEALRRKIDRLRNKTDKGPEDEILTMQLEKESEAATIAARPMLRGAYLYVTPPQPVSKSARRARHDFLVIG